MALDYLVEVVNIDRTEKWVKGPSQNGPAVMQFVERSAKDENGKYRQYINVNDKIKNKLDDKEKPAHGSKIIFKAGVKGPAGSLKGKKVHFEITYKTAKGTIKTKSRKETTDKDGWTKKLELDLSKEGDPGGTVQIEASLEDGKKLSRQPSGIGVQAVASANGNANKLTLGPYVVWRKIWFQASYMKGIGADGNHYWDLKSVQDHYDPVFIQLEMTEKKDMGLYIECINEGQHLAGFPKDFIIEQERKYEPLLTHLLFVDKMSKNADINLNIRLNNTGEIETTSLLCGAENGKWLVKEASYTDQDKKIVKISEGWFEEIKLSAVQSDYGPRTKISIKKTNHKGTVKLKAYTVDPQEYNAGMAHGHDIYVALGQWKKDYPQKEECKKKVSGTIIHEFGHQLGMVRKKQGSYISENGPHCKNKNCVMYKEQRVNKDRPLDFCEACAKSLLTMNFKELIPVK